MTNLFHSDMLSVQRGEMVGHVSLLWESPSRAKAIIHICFYGSINLDLRNIGVLPINSGA